MIAKGLPATAGTTGASVVTPIKASCKKVLYLLMVVG